MSRSDTCYIHINKNNRITCSIVYSTDQEGTHMYNIEWHAVDLYSCHHLDKTQDILTRNTLFPFARNHVRFVFDGLILFSLTPINHKSLGVTFIQTSNRDVVATEDKSVFSGFPQLVKEFSAAESNFLNFSNTTRLITQLIKRLTRMVITKVMALMAI